MRVYVARFQIFSHDRLTDWQTDRLTDWLTDKTDCLTPLRACARGVITAFLSPVDLSTHVSLHAMITWLWEVWHVKLIHVHWVAKIGEYIRAPSARRLFVKFLANNRGPDVSLVDMVLSPLLAHCFNWKPHHWQCHNARARSNARRHIWILFGTLFSDGHCGWVGWVGGASVTQSWALSYLYLLSVS